MGGCMGGHSGLYGRLEHITCLPAHFIIQGFRFTLPSVSNLKEPLFTDEKLY